METRETNSPGTPWFFYVVLALTPLLAAGNNIWFGDAAVARFIWFALVLVCWGWVMLSRPAGFREILRHRPLWPAIAFFVWLLISAACATVLDSAIRQTLWWLAAMLMGLTALQLRLTRDQILTAAAVILGASALTAIYGVYQGFYLLPALAASAGLGAEDLRLVQQAQRPFSLFIGANPFGGFMAAVAPLGVMLLLLARHRLVRLFGALCFALVVLGLIASFSRGAWVVFLFGLLPLGWMLLRGRARLALVAVFALLLVTLYLFWNMQTTVDPSRDQLTASLGGRLASIFESAEVSVMARKDYWNTASRMGADHPLTGGGMGTFGEISRIYQALPNYSRDPHNIGLKLFAETGLPGLLLFLGVVLAAFLSLHLRGRPKGSAPASPWIALSLLLLLLHASIDIDFSAPAPIALFWLWVALLMLPALPPPAAEGRPTDPMLRALAATFVILALVAVHFFALLGELYDRNALWAMEQNAHTKARELAEQAVETWPLNPAAHYRRSRLAIVDYKMTRNPVELETARRHVDTAIRLNDYNPEYRVGLADILAMSGQTGEVVQALKEAAERYPSSIHYQSEYARALSLSGDHAGALYAINSAIRDYGTEYLRHRNPNGLDLVGAHFLRAAILNEQRQWDAARAAYEAIVELCKQEGLVLSSFASMHRNAPTCQQITEQARSYMERIEEERRKPARPEGPPIPLPQLPQNLTIPQPGGRR